MLAWADQLRTSAPWAWKGNPSCGAWVLNLRWPSTVGASSLPEAGIHSGERGWAGLEGGAGEWWGLALCPPVGVGMRGTFVIQKLRVEQGWISVSELEAPARAPRGREKGKGHLPS